jgi:clan AA aspartic protease (TIGR02281 family)
MKKLMLLFFSISSAFYSFSQVVIKMKKESGVSIVPCKVNGLNLKFIFDTGASDVSISMTEASFMLKNDYLNRGDILGKSNYLDANGNITEGVNIILREIEIGGMKLYNVKASVVTNMKAPLLLGQSAISKLGAVQLDLYENTLTILKPQDSIINKLAIVENTDTVSTSSIIINQDNNKITLLLENARTSIDESSYQQAIEYCDLALNEDKNNEEAYFLRAISYDMLQDYKSAIKDYNKIITFDSKNYIYYCYRGKSKFDTEDYIGAMADLNKGLAINDKYSKGYLWRAQTKEKLKNIPSAILDIDKAILIEPLDSSLYIERAFMKQDIKDYKGSIVDCNKALNINQEYVRAYYCRGLGKKYLKDYISALVDFNQVIDLDAEYPGAYVARGDIKESQYEDFDGAMEDYKKALEIDPNYVYASILKSMLEQKIKDNVWIKSVSSKEDKWYIYNSTVSKEYSTIKIWVKNEFKTHTIKKNGKSMAYSNGNSLMLCLFQCSDKEYKILSIKNYDSKGSIINQEDFGEYGEWETPAPGTIIHKLLNDVCEKFN